MSIITATGLVKDFGTIRALSDMTLDMGPGIFGLIGPNGAGKTTLIKILLGLIRPDRGSAQVLGYDVRKESMMIRRSVGVLHEKPSYPRFMTALRYLERVRGVYGSSSMPERMLSLVGLSEASNRQIGHMSAGMLQRLGIAQALMGNPKLVLLDEPTSNLDVVGRDSILDLILSTHDELGVSYFISSHILSELERVCHQVAFVKAGQVIESGPVREIIQKHTLGTFKITTSNPRVLHEAVRDLPGILSSRVSGGQSITISFEGNNLDETKSLIDRAAGSVGVSVFAYDAADTLEEAFRQLMHDEMGS